MYSTVCTEETELDRQRKSNEEQYFARKLKIYCIQSLRRQNILKFTVQYSNREDTEKGRQFIKITKKVDLLGEKMQKR